MSHHYVEPDLKFVEGVIASGGDTVKRCYQCATCAVVCPLSTEDVPFPRKQMILAQWGMADRVAKDPAIWLCHQCSDCTAYCPRGARPGDVLSAIRAMAIRELAEPKFLWSLYNSLAGTVLLFGFALAVIFAMLLIVHQGLPELESPVRFSHGLFHGFLPVLAVDAIFLPVAGFAAIIAWRGISNLWRQLNEGANIPVAYRATTWELIKDHVIPVFKEILNHERFKKCVANLPRYSGHRLVLWAFIILFFVTMVVFFFADIVGTITGNEIFHTPWPLWNPIKILGNLGGFILIYGAILLIQNRKAKEAEGIMRSSYSDWFFLYLVLFVGITGLAAQYLRIFDLKIAYFVYVAHLACIFVLFLGLPYSKFAHLLYRTTVMVFDHYMAGVRTKMAAATAALSQPKAQEEPVETEAIQAEESSEKKEA
ncbi:heterodisulfide reductase, subunit E (HdrE) [Thermodesulfatator indicus DSM 15286]|uniref:Heterodisulfide reductase, subunit E (HdrE) n=1 Tax=Thermodesulfatator indicus (strain DSM 15286 / JCM 11887 / CIR29812) TaxID=667014 RepID=F8A9W8_THEID|nr:quinone-interacting membrane-bound oxidoreductase complex subunit QmoC [Thermodesulfatator indicus]AEH44166.1 heterodisulfide reductase, subunit E (HdrE) [Thermodesulfatator indicus DSM 15286]